MYVLPNRSKKHSEYFKRFGEQENKNTYKGETQSVMGTYIGGWRALAFINNYII